MTATALSSALALQPAHAQPVPYNPNIRAPAPVFKPFHESPLDIAERNRKLGTAAAVAAVAFLIWVATRNRSRSDDDRPTWTPKSPGSDVIWHSERVPEPERPAPPAPAISPFYE